MDPVPVKQVIFFNSLSCRVKLQPWSTV